jgi:putative transposase
MPRTARYAPAGFVYHVFNRAVARLTLFEKAGDYRAFEDVLQEALAREPLPILCFCLMPNHWHFVVQPEHDEQVSDFFRWLTHTHAMRWHAHHHTAGTGHLYQGRFKSFPVEDDAPLYRLLRYVERNPRRANLVERASQWRWGSGWHRRNAESALGRLLAPWPVPMPADWETWVDEPQTEAELAAIRRSVNRGRPYGSEPWVRQTAARLGLQPTLRPRGRPRKYLA